MTLRSDTWVTARNRHVVPTLRKGYLELYGNSRSRRTFFAHTISNCHLGRRPYSFHPNDQVKIRQKADVTNLALLYFTSLGDQLWTTLDQNRQDQKMFC